MYNHRVWTWFAPIHPSWSPRSTQRVNSNRLSLGGIKYWKEQHTLIHWHNTISRTYKGEHPLGTASTHTYGIQSAQPLAALHACCCNTISTCLTLALANHSHKTLSAQHTISTTYYRHITLATQHAIGTMYMILSQSFAGKCKIYLWSNSSMLPIYINSKSIYNCRGWRH